MPEESGAAVVREALAKLVVTGPCRSQGDAYLECVLTRGKGKRVSLHHAAPFFPHFWQHPRYTQDSSGGLLSLRTVQPPLTHLKVNFFGLLQLLVLACCQKM